MYFKVYYNIRYRHQQIMKQAHDPVHYILLLCDQLYKLCPEMVASQEFS